MKACIVVAEDDPDILRLLSDTLTFRGYRVLSARTGEQAWQTIREDQPTVAVLDLRMPGLDGLEVCRRIRADRKVRDMGVIILTADRRRREEAERAGADAFLVKPFSPRELQQQVAAVEKRKTAS